MEAARTWSLQIKDRNYATTVRRAVLRFLVLTAVAWLGSDAQAQSPVAPTQPAAPPDFAVVKAAVEKYFAGMKDFQPGDLIRQSQVEQALAVVEAAGWDVTEKAELVKRALPDGSFLVKELSTPGGRKFMRRVARHAGTYSRLERLSTIAGGETLIRDLIQQKDGDKLIEYLATTQGGQKMGRMAANTRHGVDLNKPTQRIYTSDELLAELEKAHRALSAKKKNSGK
jgi:hypothetical protein